MDNYKGFYKVNEDNGGVCVGTFWNPDTKETFTKITVSAIKRVFLINFFIKPPIY